LCTRSRSFFNSSTTADMFAIETPGVDDNKKHVHRKRQSKHMVVSHSVLQWEH
jgi:hypothetical protein